MIIEHTSSTVVLSVDTVINGRKDLNYIKYIINSDNSKDRLDLVNAYKLEITTLCCEDRFIKQYRIKDLEILDREYKLIYESVGNYTKVIINTKYKIIRE